MKMMRSGFSRSSRMIPFRRSSNWPRYFVPATMSERSSARIFFCARNIGHRALDDPRRETLDDRRLADAGLPEEDRVVLRAAGEDLDDPLDFLLAADQRVERPGRGELRQVPAVLGEERKLLLLLGDLALLDERDRLLPHAVEVEAPRGEQPARPRTRPRAAARSAGARSRRRGASSTRPRARRRRGSSWTPRRAGAPRSRRSARRRCGRPRSPGAPPPASR